MGHMYLQTHTEAWGQHASTRPACGFPSDVFPDRGVGGGGGHGKLATVSLLPFYTPIADSRMNDGESEARLRESVSESKGVLFGLPLNQPNGTNCKEHAHMAVGQNQWYQFVLGAPSILEPIFSFWIG